MAEDAQDAAARAYWSAEADRFDDEPDHGLRDPAVAAAWRRLLGPLLGEHPLAVADLGCGTGSLALLLAELGHTVHGVDFAEAMVVRARAKVGGLSPQPRLVVGDAERPPLRADAYDVVLVRHVTWALPDPAAALRQWSRMLHTGGRLLLVEGQWATGSGLPAARLVEFVRSAFADVRVQRLEEPELWGREISDERYLLTARRRTATERPPA